jgi:hypothetical protein
MAESDPWIDEKVDAEFEATANLMAGASADGVIHR